MIRQTEGTSQSSSSGIPRFRRSKSCTGRSLLHRCPPRLSRTGSSTQCTHHHLWSCSSGPMGWLSLLLILLSLQKFRRHILHRHQPPSRSSTGCTRRSRPRRGSCRRQQRSGHRRTPISRSTGRICRPDSPNCCIQDLGSGGFECGQIRWECQAGLHQP